MRIISGGLDDPDVQALLEHHARTARAETAVGSAHALDLGGLRAANMTFWSAWDDERLLGVGALKQLSPLHGEIKSMHTGETSRRTGVGTRALYRNHGFVECGPFGEYVADPNSVFMAIELGG
jgi:putative acetyltransferase